MKEVSLMVGSSHTAEAAKLSRRTRLFQYRWYLFLLPSLLGIAVFLVYPILSSFRLSFYKSNSVTESFRGLQNYKNVLTDELFWKGVWNTFYISFFALLLVIPISFILACVINEMRIGKNLAKSTFLISYITPGIAASTIFLFVFHPQGIMNMILGWFGIGGVEWLSRPISAQWAVILYNVWKGIGFNMIIFLANLQAVPRELYEAASIDGSTQVKSWRYITIPQMKPTIGFLYTMGWIGGLQRFSDVFIFGNGSTGSPERSLYTIVSYIYDHGFGSFEFGMASAAAYVLFAIILIFTYLNKRLTKFGEKE